MKNLLLQVIKQEEYDRYVFLTYSNSEIVGLNFHQGIDKVDYSFAEPCVHLSEIFRRLTYDNKEYSITDWDERVNKAISLFENSFIFQDSEKQIFNDVDGNELKVGDKVVCVDVDDLESHIISRGLVLEVHKLIDLESCYIEFKGVDCLVSFYGHRVLKLKS
jgi:hypothetical protein